MAGLAQAGLWERFWEYGYCWPLLGGMAIAALCGVLSVFVVLKRMAFIGQGISHAAFGGVGAAVLGALAADLYVPAWQGALASPLARDAVVAAFCVISAVVIGYLSRRGRFSEDTAIGIVLVAAMALGVVLLDVRARWLSEAIGSGLLTRGQVGYTPSFHYLLFGDILSITRSDVVVAGVLTGIVIATTIALFKELVFFAFDEETAGVFGVPIRALYYGLLVCLGVAIVASMRSLGVVLASALLVLPGAAARCWSRRIGIVTILSALLAVAGVAAGLLLAIQLRFLSPGPVIVLTLCLLLAISYVLGRRKGRA